MFATLLLGFAGLAPAQEPQEPWWERIAGPEAHARAEQLVYAGLPARTHAGLGVEEDLEAALEFVSHHDDPALPSLIAAAAMAPERVSGRPPLSPPARARRVAELLEELLSGPAWMNRDLVVARLRPNLQARDAEFLLGRLQDGQLAHRGSALDLFLTIPWEVARPVWVRFLLDEEMPLTERTRVMDRYLRAAGPDGIGAVRDLLDPRTEEPLLRRFLITWQPMMRPEDLDLVARIAREGEDAVRTLALQMWARRETRPERRLAIFDRCAALEPSARETVLESLARRGRHAGIAERLLFWLDAARSEKRRAAMHHLPRFASAEVLVAEYLKRLDRGASLRERALWVRELVDLPLEEALAESARWLLDGGWREAPTGRQVARTLMRRPGFDAWLDRFLRQEEIPEELRHSAAAARTETSEVARAYLRERLHRFTGLRQVQAVRALAAHGGAAEHARLLELVHDPEADPTARGAAVEALAARPRGPDWIGPLLEEDFRAYEVLDALVRAGHAVGLHAEVARLRTRLAPALDEEERLGLERASWSARARHPGDFALGDLARALAAELRARPPDPEREAQTLPEPRVLHMRQIEVRLRATAVAARVEHLRRGGGLPEPDALRSLAELDPSAIGAEPLLVAASWLREELPGLAADWLSILGRRPGLAGNAALRAQAGAARASWGGPDPGLGLELLQPLLADPRRLREQPWELAWGLGLPAARSWRLAYDRLHERRVLLEAERAEGEDRLRWLEDLLHGHVARDHLIEAASRAAETPGGADLTVRLAARAVTWSPEQASARGAHALALEDAGRSEEAVRAWRAVRRLAQLGDPWRDEAERRLEVLDTGSD